jgi:hypothetical protein
MNDMFHYLIFNLAQDEQLHDMNEYLIHFDLLNQDKLTMNNRVLNLIKKNILSNLNLS